MFFKGDALSEIKKFKIKEDDSLDIDNIPEFVKKPMMVMHFDSVTVKDDKGKDKIVKKYREPVQEMGRDLGATISLLTVAVQQLVDRVEVLEKKNDNKE